MKTKYIHIIAVLFLTVPSLLLAFEFDLISTGADYSGSIGKPNTSGSFSITVRLTATEKDLFVHKHYDLFDGSHNSTVIYQNGNHTVATPVMGYLISPVVYPNDALDWYSIPEGQSRNFQFTLSHFVPTQTGFYSWGLTVLNPLEISEVAGGIIQDFVLVDVDRFRTDQLYLVNIIPEPSSAVLALIGVTAFTLRKRH